MNKQRLQLLLAAWCVLVIAPGVLAVAVGVTADSNVTGKIVGSWIVGYLAQFFVFMVIMRMVNKNTTFLPWVVASMLPWLVDWTVPVSWLLLAPWVVVAVGTAWWIHSSADREEELRTAGVPAVATVLKVIEPRFFNTVVNGVYIKRKLRLQIVRSDGTPPYEAVYHGTFMLGEIPSEGSRLSIRVDPKNPQHFTTDLNAADVGSGGDTFDLSGGYPSNDSPPDGSTSDDVSSALEKLAALHKAGSLTDAEFAKAKEQVLGAS